MPRRLSPFASSLKPEEVKRRAHRGEKDGRISYWLQPAKYYTDEFREAWLRIGTGDESALTASIVETSRSTPEPRP